MLKSFNNRSQKIHYGLLLEKLVSLSGFDKQKVFSLLPGGLQRKTRDVERENRQTDQEEIKSPCPLCLTVWSGRGTGARDDRGTMEG